MLAPVMVHADTTSPPVHATAIVPAGGRGSRMGGDLPKQFLQLGDVPMLVHTVRALLACPLIAEVVVVVPPSETDTTRKLLARAGLDRIVGPVAGGATRQQSVLNGLNALPHRTTVVAVHDAARPFPDPDTLSHGIQRAVRDQVGVVVGRPCNDTIKRVDGRDRITDTPDRTTLWQAFTPQIFPVKMIVEAYHRAQQQGHMGTDDASLVEWTGQPVSMLEGGRESLKVTRPQDLITARAWLKADRL